MTGTEEEREKRADNWPLYLEVLFPNLETRTPLPDPTFGANSDIKELLSDGAPTDKKNIAASKLYGSGRSPLWPQAYEPLSRYLERLERVLIRLLRQIDVLPIVPIDPTKSPQFVGDSVKKALSSDENVNRHSTLTPYRRPRPTPL